jgi:hypothetical protein
MDAMRTLTAIPAHWFSWDFRLHDEGGVPCGEVALSVWRERGAVTVDGHTYAVSREGLLGAFVVAGPNGESARAVKPSVLRQEFRLAVGGDEYTLSRVSWPQREFALKRAGTRVGSVTPVSWLSRRARAQLPDELPSWAGAFAVWLTLLMWKPPA